jgi:hypothetical protein
MSHHKGHVRDTFLRAIDAFYDWRMTPGKSIEPTVEHEINYEPTQISLAQACGLVWRCTDTLPGLAFNMIANEDLDLGLRSSTYAAAAHAMAAYLKTHPSP